MSLLGIWSVVKQGVITDLSKSTVAKLTKGLPDQTIKLAKKEVFKKLGEGFLTFFVINLILGIFWWIINEGSKYGRVTFTEIRNNQVVKQEVIGSTKEPNKEMIQEDKNTIMTESSPNQVESTQVEFSFYSNTMGKYSYQYPSNWKHNEIVNKDLNSPDQKILSVFSLVVNLDYAPVFGSLEVSYQLDDGQCIEKDENFLRNMIKFKTKVGGQAVEAFERQELNESINRFVYQRFIFLPKGDRCYKILILDQEGNPNSQIFKQILSSFKFLD